MAPVPKRSEERIRRNKLEVPIEKLEASGEVKIPTLRIKDCRGIVRDLYEAFKQSAQAKYYEPTDWEMIRLTLILLNDQLKAPKPNSQIITAIMSQFSDLLATEGARRKLRLEIERKTEGAGEENVVDIAQLIAQRQQAL